MALTTFLQEALWLPAGRSDPSVGADRINFIKTCTKLYFCIALELKRLTDVFVISHFSTRPKSVFRLLPLLRTFRHEAVSVVVAMRYHSIRIFKTEGAGHELFAAN